MKRTPLLIILLSIFLLIGCSKDDPEDTTPTEPEITYILTLSDVPEVLVGIEGAPRSFTFLVTVATDEGLVVGDKTVNLRVESGVGNFESPEIVTNTYGVARATYSFNIPTGQNTFRLLAELDGFIGSTDVRVISLAKPDAVDLTAEKTSYVGIEGENVRIVMSALLTDAQSNGVGGVNLAFGIAPLVEGGAIFGVLSSSDATDENGEVDLVFQSNGGFGRQKIYCQVNEPDGYLAEVRDELTIDVQSLNDAIGSFLLNSDSNYLEVSESEPETVNVSIDIRDQDGHGIEDISMNVTTDVGYIIGSAVTDELGKTSVQYFVEYNNIADTTTSTTIYASIPGTDWEVRTTIYLTKVGSGRTYLRLITDTRSILADNGITSANLNLTLRDEHNQAIAGQAVRFSSTHGLVSSPIITDENGFARNVFIDNGLPSIDDEGFPDSAVVRAYVPELEAEDDVKIMILTWDAVGSLEAANPQDPVVVGGADSCIISAQAFRPTGSLLGNGILIHFEPTYGITSPRHALTVNGVAEVTYFSPFNACKDTVVIWTLFDGERIETRAIVTVLPGEPGRMTISADTDTLRLNEPDAHATVTATVFDVYDNPVVGGGVVEFTSSRGSIVSPANINNQGQASARFTPGMTAGYCFITASTEGSNETIHVSTSILIELPGPESFNLRLSHNQLAVAGQDETSTATIFANVLDINGAIIDSAFTVGFELVSDLALPHGCSLGEDQDVQLVFVSAEHGIATSTVNAGDSLGIREIRAFTWRDVERMDTISATVGFEVFPGEAQRMTMNYNPEPISSGGGTWLMEVWVDVRDGLGYPVRDGAGVAFSLDPQIATISRLGVMNQPGLHGEARPGRAYATLSYQSENVFGNVSITAEIPTVRYGVITTATDLVLPLSGGVLTLNASPGNWNYGDDGDIAQIWVQATLRDGQRNLINNGNVRFHPEAGSLYYFDEQDQELQPMQESVRITGLVDEYNAEEPGQATVYLLIEENEAFPFEDDPDDPNDNIVVITLDATLDGYRDVASAPLEITLTRPQE